MIKSVRTCTCAGEVVDGECLECKTWDKIKKNFKPKYDNITKVSTVTIRGETFEEYKKATRNGEQ